MNEHARRPQAVAWASLGLARQVGLYVRALCAAERSSASVAARELVVRLQDSLGLTVTGLRSARWVMVGDASALKATGTEAPTAKSHFKLLDGGN